jgi:tRNA-modifying protein YgfZ
MTFTPPAYLAGHASSYDPQAQHFGDLLAEQRAALVADCIAPLPHLGVILASGEDAGTFLQNQLTNDTRELSSDMSQLAGWCSAKGRILTLFRLVQRPEGIFLILPLERLEATLKRLRMFVLRSKVTLSDVSNEWPLIGLLGDGAISNASTPIAPLPHHSDATLHNEEMTLVRLLGNQPRALLMVHRNISTATWQRLVSQCQPVGRAAWELIAIRSGEPQVWECNVEAFVPQMMNLPLLNGVSFKKGCYPGQEVVARMQYLGKLKRRMYHLQGSGAVPACGEELASPASASGQGAGRVVATAPNPEGGFDLLAVMEIALIDNQSEIHLERDPSVKLTLAPLPYELPPVVAAERPKL